MYVYVAEHLQTFRRDGSARAPARERDRTRTLEDTRRFKWLFDRQLQHVQGRLSFNKGGEPVVFQSRIDGHAGLENSGGFRGWSS